VTEYIYNVPTALHFPAKIACHVVAPYEANAYLGQQVVELAKVALTRQLETDTGADGYMYDLARRRGLPKKTIASIFDPTDEKRCIIVGQKIEKSIDPQDNDTLHARGVCAVALDDTGILGFARVTRKRQTEDLGHRISDSGYDLRIEEVLARSPRRHLGSIALYTALRIVDDLPGDRIIYEGLDRNGPNRWFEKLGFKIDASGEAVPSLEVGPFQLALSRYVLHPATSKKKLMTRMATKRPWLAAAREIEC
jgi:hypothetical protein